MIRSSDLPHGYGTFHAACSSRAISLPHALAAFADARHSMVQPVAPPSVLERIVSMVGAYGVRTHGALARAQDEVQYHTSGHGNSNALDKRVSG